MSIYVSVSMSVDTWAKHGRTHTRLPRGVTAGDGSRRTATDCWLFYVTKEKVASL